MKRKTLKQKEFGLGFRITKKIVEDDLYGPSLDADPADSQHLKFQGVTTMEVRTNPETFATEYRTTTLDERDIADLVLISHISTGLGNVGASLFLSKELSRLLTRVLGDEFYRITSRHKEKQARIEGLERERVEQEKEQLRQESIEREVERRVNENLANLKKANRNIKRRAKRK